MRHPTIWFLPLLAAGLSAHDAGRVSSIVPAKPRAGAELRLCYDPGAPGAALAIDDEVYAIASFFTAGRLNGDHVRLEPSDGLLCATVVVPGDATNVIVDFVTRAAYDRAAHIEAMIHGEDGLPVRGARPRTAFDAGSEYLDVIDAELEHYPDNYSAYRTKWFVSTVYSKPGELADMVDGDMIELEGKTTPGALWARSYGHMLLGEEPAARELVLQALADYPRSFEAARAVGDYEYQVFSQSLEGAGSRQVAARKAEVVAAHPDIWLARDAIRVLAYQPTFPLDVTRAVCEGWMAERPLHPEPSLVLARALLNHGVELDRAAELIGRAVDGYVRGDMRLCGDYAGSMTEMLLPNAYETMARIELARGHPGRAIAAARAAAAVETRTSARAAELEAEIWQSVGRVKDAERAWARALCAGSTTARAELERLFADREGDPAGFADHLAALVGEADEGARPPAPSFEGRDLDGEAFDSESLLGRVVVLNFWGLGCAPCKVEIPHLNKLVESFRDQPVEFIAFATDPADALREYLADHPFDYRVVASASRPVRAYQVRVWPTHVIIDQRGRVAATFVGGGKGVDERFRPVIERLLDQ